MRPVLVAWALAGFASWPAMEYLVHGVLSHRLRTFVSPMHWEHHEDEHAVFTSASAWVPASAFLWAMLALAIGATASAAFLAGLLVGFQRYERVHWAIHFREPRDERERVRRLHHLAHHYRDPSMYHGVTTRLLDRLCGTLPADHEQAYASVADRPLLVARTGESAPVRRARA
ncbi:sterol desaturase family protein [bacterium]|nr:sterol desaturase family protein [bacterium]